jgi:AraC-like DNA-binding protein
LPISVDFDGCNFLGARWSQLERNQHQYVIARRVERAQQLLRGDGDLGLAEVALRVGFSDQSQFSFHFKRIVGVTPGQFRISARIA